MDKEQNKQPIEQTEQISVPEVDTTADVASSAPVNGGDPDGGIAGMRPETAPVIKKDSRAKFNKFALLSIILTLAAWVVLSFEGKGRGADGVCGLLPARDAIRRFWPDGLTAVSPAHPSLYSRPAVCR